MTPDEFEARVWEILSVIDKDKFQVVAAPGPSDAEVARIEEDVEFSLPEDYLAFARKKNGLAVVATPEAWPESEQYDVGPAWTFWSGVLFLGVDTEELPDWASIGPAIDDLDERGVTGVLPLIQVMGDGDRMWGITASGKPVEVWDDEVTVLDGSILDVYEQQINELMKRQQDIEAGLGRS